jgi:uncharacterized protein YecT (DUF1311 family)
MTKLSRFLVLGAAASLASTAACAAADTSCRNAKTQPELSACAGKDAQAADTELNHVYGQLIAKYDEPNRNALVLAERAWIVYRDVECAYETALSAGGTIHPMMVALCMTAKAKTRTKELNDQLNCKEGDLDCNKP